MKFLNVLNRFVSVVLVSVALTAALQFGGVASHSKDSADYEALSKSKSDYATDVIDSIFNIPIATLNAVNRLVQSTEPLWQITAERKAEKVKARTELLQARAESRQAKNEAKALRRADRGRHVIVVQEDPVVVVKKEGSKDDY